VPSFKKRNHGRREKKKKNRCWPFGKPQIVSFQRKNSTDKKTREIFFPFGGGGRKKKGKDLSQPRKEKRNISPEKKKRDPIAPLVLWKGEKKILAGGGGGG